MAIQGLFGRYDHRVDLRIADRVTIIHGPNGVGKTKLLEQLAALLRPRPRFSQLLAVPFRELRVDFDSREALIVRQRDDGGARSATGAKQGKPRRRQAGLEFALTRGGKQETWDVPAAISDLAARPRSHLPPWFSVTTDGLLFDSRTGVFMSPRDAAMRYGFDESVLDPQIDMPQWLTEFLASAAVHLIETQRLVKMGRRPNERRRDPDEVVPVSISVREIASELAEKIKTTQDEYARVAQRLEKTYVDRLLRLRDVPVNARDRLRERLAALDDSRVKLESIGLLDVAAQTTAVAASDLASLPEDKYPVLALFVDDSEQKLSVLEPLAQAVETLLNGVNRKFRNKYVRVVRDEGLIVEIVDDDAGQPGAARRHPRTIPLDQLSSGEQHEMVLLYDLLFRVRKNTLVLIDEPELSLHPEWQMKFVDDLLSVANKQEFDVVLATHSPYVIGDRSDLCVLLTDQKQAVA